MEIFSKKSPTRPSLDSQIARRHSIKVLSLGERKLSLYSRLRKCIEKILGSYRQV